MIFLYNKDIFQPHSTHIEALYIQSWMEQYPWLVAGFSTRRGGSSLSPFDSLNCGLHVADDPAAVVKNRERLIKLQNVPFASWTCANQIHGSTIYQVQATDIGKGRDSLNLAIPGVDGLYTCESNLFLASFYADCVPIFFIDPTKRLIGIVHAGWKGTVAQIGKKLIQRWKEEFNSALSDIKVVIGPAIGGCCYEVDDTVMDQVKPFLNLLSKKAITVKCNRKYQIDLKQINFDLLNQAGIRSEHIEVSEWCTSCNTDLFYSHRKENGVTGRMAAFMTIKEEEMKH